MEIMVQRHTHPFVLTSLFQDMDILGPFQSDFGNVNRIQSVLAQDRSGTRSESLVQQNPNHATRSTLNRSSSTVAAA
jgi:hypothetical protein